jgi:hypothetical protein
VSTADPGSTPPDSSSADDGTRADEGADLAGWSGEAGLHSPTGSDACRPPAHDTTVGDAVGWHATLTRIPVGDVLRRALHPPLSGTAFWVVQASVVALTIVHLILDHTSVVDAPALASVPVAALFVPVACAALRFGLHGSAATALWATVLWIPDLATPHHHGDPGSDLVSLLLIDTVAVIVGQRIE